MFCKCPVPTSWNSLIYIILWNHFCPLSRINLGGICCHLRVNTVCNYFIYLLVLGILLLFPHSTLDSKFQNTGTGLLFLVLSLLPTICKLSCPMAYGSLVLWPGIEPTSPALEGRFLTTGPPGKSSFYFFSCFLLSLFRPPLPVPFPPRKCIFSFS